MAVKAQMRAAIEQHEVQSEEAKAANEELQAMNEELRSTAEELETSQEELQSVNEELQTVNQELKVKIEEISHASDDLRNLISSTDIGTIFVDRSFRVKLFTPRALQVFNLIPADTGRSLSDITNKLVAGGGLADEMARVIERLQPIERAVETRDGLWYLMRLLPYRTSDDRIDGLVLTFLDITERHHAEEALEERVRERTRELVDLDASRQQLLERLFNAIEDERQRIARELHDEMGQHMTALRVRLDSLKPVEHIDELKAITARIDRSIDRLMLELRPPALDQGLRGAITSLTDDFSATSGIVMAVHFGIDDGERFGEAIETTLYRVLQESLTNVSKHSSAKTVSVIVERERDMLRLIVEDDGEGFEPDEAPARGRFGLLGMRERLAMVKGTFTVEPRPGSGATIYARVPLPEGEGKKAVLD
jgi:two-component system CheB/CheR fusion protein